MSRYRRVKVCAGLSKAILSSSRNAILHDISLIVPLLHLISPFHSLPKKENVFRELGCLDRQMNAYRPKVLVQYIISRTPSVRACDEINVRAILIIEDHLVKYCRTVDRYHIN